MKDKPLWIVSCPLCRVFSHGEIKTKLYWPENPEDIRNSEFIIVDCMTCKIPMVIYRDHVSSILNEPWGRILYRCKKIFGEDVKLRCKAKSIKDHFHCHIVKENY